MGSGDLSTELGFGVLAPTPAVRAVEGHSAPQQAQAKARRRPRLEEENHAEESPSSDGLEQPAHQLDDLA